MLRDILKTRGLDYLAVFVNRLGCRANRNFFDV